MRILKVCALALLVLSLPVVYGQPYPISSWQSVFGGSSYDRAYDIQQTMDSGYIVVGTTRSFGGGEQNIFIIKTDSIGDSLWTRTYGGADVDAANSVRQTPDGGYIVTGSSMSFGPGYSGLYLLKINEVGDSMWTCTYGGNESDGGKVILPASNGGYLIAGQTHSYGAGEIDFRAVRVDSMGDTLWTRTYGGEENDYLKDAKQTFDEVGYIFFGETCSFRPGVTQWPDFYAVRTNADGDTLWTHTYGETHSEYAKAVAQTHDEGYIMVGSTVTATDVDFYCVKVDSRGIEEWTRIWGDEYCEHIQDVLPTSDGGYMLLGCGGYNYGGAAYISLIKIDDLGNVLWEQQYGGRDNDWPSALQSTTDGGFIIAGRTYSFGAGSADVYLVKTGEDVYALPRIVVSTDTLEFGSVLVGEQEDLPLTLYNFGGVPLILRGIYSSDSSFTTDFDPADSLVNPNENLQVRVIFAPEDSLYYDEILTIENNDTLVEVRLLGLGQPPSADNTSTVAGLPNDYSLYPMFPNPFNTTSTIRYDVPVRGVVEVDVYDVLGRMVTTLVDGDVEAGRHRVMWDAGDMPSGVYFVQMLAGGYQQVRKVVLLK